MDADATQVAALLQVNPRTVAKWRYVGGGPKYCKLQGKFVRYRQSAIDAWLQQHERAHPSEETLHTPVAVLELRPPQRHG
jgi:predicted DNA-binding transcriptional regulator AlpA